VNVQRAALLDLEDRNVRESRQHTPKATHEFLPMRKHGRPILDVLPIRESAKHIETE
jgi:hypothetical protein